MSQPVDQAEIFGATTLRRTRKIPPQPDIQERALNMQRERIRLLNRELLKDFSKGRVVITRGIDALGKEAVGGIAKAIASYEGFSEDSDPHGENDFGSLEYEGHRVFFKIDYLDLALSMHSPDPSDPQVTERVLTILLAEEY